MGLVLYLINLILCQLYIFVKVFYRQKLPSQISFLSLSLQFSKKKKEHEYMHMYMNIHLHIDANMHTPKEEEKTYIFGSENGQN